VPVDLDVVRDAGLGVLGPDQRWREASAMAMGAEVASTTSKVFDRIGLEER